MTCSTSSKRRASSKIALRKISVATTTIEAPGSSVRSPVEKADVETLGLEVAGPSWLLSALIGAV